MTRLGFIALNASCKLAELLRHESATLIAILQTRARQSDDRSEDFRLQYPDSGESRRKSGDTPETETG